MELRQCKIISYLLQLVIILLCYGVSNGASNCEKTVSMAYLNTAVDMITKAKLNIPADIKCGSNKTHGALDCSDLLQADYSKSGVYTIRPVSRVNGDKSLEVYCDMQTNGGGWTLIQRRGDFKRPNDYFYKDWKSYKEGFGDIEKDFWLGNDNIYALTNQKVYSVRFHLKDFENNTRYAQYDAFWIDDEDHKYTLHIADYSGDAGDSMIEQHNNQKFSTKDQENDNQGDQNCAQLYKGAWWYNSCHHSNLNGLYHRGKHDSFADGIDWLTWKGYHESLESTAIMIRPKNFRLPRVSLKTPM